MTTSIKDVAAHAGVSVATVSRVLSNGPVSDSLKERVRAAIAETGYRPNLSARRLRSQHSQTVGLIVSDIRNPFFTAVSKTVEDGAFQVGMRTILCNTDEDPMRESMYLRLMQEERVSGLIYAPTVGMADKLGDIPLDIPTVLIDRSNPQGLYDAVVLDNRQAAATLVDHLVEQGYRHIGGLFGNTSTTGAERHQGFCQALERHGLPAPARFMPPREDEAVRETLQWLHSADRPDALIASNGLLLAGIVHALRDEGLHMPDDMAVAGFDNDRWTSLVGPGLTVIEQPIDEIGQTAMRLLFERLETPTAPPRKVVLTGRCVVRGSTVRQSQTVMA